MKESIFFVVAFALGVLGMKFYNNFAHWHPDPFTPPMVFSDGGEHPSIMVQLDNNGVLHLDLPKIYQNWQDQIKKGNKK